METELCSSFITYPEKFACNGITFGSNNNDSYLSSYQQGPIGKCKIDTIYVKMETTGDIIQRKEPRCECFNNLWQGIGDFTPSYSIHCGLFSSAIQALWWICIYFQVSLFVYSCWTMFKYVRENYIKKDNINNNNNPASLLISIPNSNSQNHRESVVSNYSLKGKKRESFRSRGQSTNSYLYHADTYNSGNNFDQPKSERVNDNIHHITRSNSNFEVITSMPAEPIGTNMIIENVEQNEQLEEWKKIWSSAFFSLFSFVSSAIGISICGLKLYDPIYYGIGRDISITILFSIFNIFFWCNFAVYFHNKTLIVYALSRKPRSRKEWNAASRGRFLNYLLFPCIAIVSTFVSLLPLLLIFDLGDIARTYNEIIDAINIILIILFLTYELIVFMAIFGHALAISSLRPQKDPFANNITILKTRSKKRQSVNPPIYKFPTLDDIEESNVDKVTSPARSPVIKNIKSNRNVEIERLNSKYSEFSPNVSQASIWTVNFLSPRTIEMVKISLISLVAGLPLLSMIAWPYLARRFSYILPIFISGQCIAWAYILYESSSYHQKKELIAKNSNSNADNKNKRKSRNFINEDKFFDDENIFKKDNNNSSSKKDNEESKSWVESRSLTVATGLTYQRNNSLRTTQLNLPSPPSSPNRSSLKSFRDGTQTTNLRSTFIPTPPGSPPPLSPKSENLNQQPPLPSSPPPLSQKQQPSSINVSRSTISSSKLASPTLLQAKTNTTSPLTSSSTAAALRLSTASSSTKSKKSLTMLPPSKNTQQQEEINQGEENKGSLANSTKPIKSQPIDVSNKKPIEAISPIPITSATSMNNNRPTNFLQSIKMLRKDSDEEEKEDR